MKPRVKGVIAILGATIGLSVFVLAGPASAATARPNVVYNSVCPYSHTQATVSEGSTGPVVEQAQCEMYWGYAVGHGGLSIDGDFGPQTLAVTKAFQACAGISVDGIIGPQTWSKLDYYFTHNGYCGD
jgi:zinc D-Ala-D-Ala carboxypeptidase